MPRTSRRTASTTRPTSTTPAASAWSRRSTAGRAAPLPVPGTSATLPCDLAIKALGFDPEDLPAAFDEPALAVTRWGTLRVDRKSKMTALDGVFAAGDIIRGASLVVWAIKDGRDAADGIDAHIRSKAAAEAPAVAAE